MIPPRIRRARRALATVAGVAALVLAFSACSSTGGDPAESPHATEEGAAPQSGGTLVYYQDLEPQDWDVSHVWPVSLLSIGGSIYDRLVKLDTDGEYHPWLATEWEFSEDAKSITFQLRDDVTFHDGAKFDASAVAANFDKWRDDPVSNTWSGVNIESYEVLGDYEFKLNLLAPNAGVLWRLSTANFGFLSPDAIANPDADFTDGNWAIGSGPFKVEEYNRGQNITLVRNEDYNWGPDSAEHEGPAYLDEIDINFTADATARLGALQSEQADLIANIPALNLEDIRSDERFQVVHGQATGTPYELYLNTAVAPTDDVRVREALRSALDIQGTLDGIYFGEYPQAWTDLAPNTPPSGSYNDALEGSYGFDVEKANDLLDEAGWTEKDGDGFRVKDGERLSLAWPVDAPKIEDQRDVLAQAIKDQAAEVGIEILIDNIDSAARTERIKSLDYNIVDRTWSTADANVIRVFLESGLPETGGNNYSYVVDEEATALQTTILENTDPAARAEAAQRLQELVTENVWTIPLYPRQINLGAAAGVHGVEVTLDGWLDTLYDVWKEQ